MKYILPAKKNTNYISTLMPFLVIIGQLMFIFGAQAQTRPYDNTEINIVNKGGLQSDIYFGKNNTSSLDVFNLSTMLRYGLTNNMELQVEWASDKFRHQNVKLNGTNEVTTIGLKIHLTDDGSILPALSAIITSNLTFDTDNRIFLPRLNILFEKAITSSFNANGNFEVQVHEDSGDLFINYTFNLEADIANWQTTYIGITGNNNSFKLENETYQNYLEIGMLFYISDGIVIYPFYDVGLNDASGDIFNIGALFTLGK